jgi:hypothetical protein
MDIDNSNIIIPMLLDDDDNIVSEQKLARVLESNRYTRRFERIIAKLCKSTRKYKKAGAGEFR